MTVATPSPLCRVVAAAALASTLLGPVAALVSPAARAGAATTGDPKVVITPGPVGGGYADGQTVRVSVGPNSLFTPHTRIIILECADPTGSRANLPISFTDCDGTTDNADTVLVQNDGSFTESAYQVYALPNIVLGETPTTTPVCNPTSACVLYVGQDQNDFTRPKVFSGPFTFTSTAKALATGSTTTTPAPTATTTPSSASASVTLGPATLAFTGWGTGSWFLGAAGAALFLGGLLGRRRIRGWHR